MKIHLGNCNDLHGLEHFVLVEAKVRPKIASTQGGTTRHGEKVGSAEFLFDLYQDSNVLGYLWKGNKDSSTPWQKLGAPTMGSDLWRCYWLPCGMGVDQQPWSTTQG